MIADVIVAASRKDDQRVGSQVCCIADGMHRIVNGLFKGAAVAPSESARPGQGGDGQLALGQQFNGSIDPEILELRTVDPDAIETARPISPVRPPRSSSEVSKVD